MMSCPVLFMLMVGIADAGRLVRPTASSEADAQETELSKFLAKEAQYDEADAKAGRSRTEIKTMMVYKVQPSTLLGLSNSNAADVIGELTFLAADIQISELRKLYEVIVQDEVEIKLATNPDRAYNHYLRFIGGSPDKDPTEYGIDTVGFKMRDIGGEGWLSFPYTLKCSDSQSVGDGCAWKVLRRVRTIHTTCLLGLVDDGPHGSGRSFEDVLKRFNAPSAGETFLDFNQKLAISTFGKAFEQCPDVGYVEVIPHNQNTRRCCCFNGNHPAKNPLWVQQGVCLKDDARQQKMFGDMWSMSRSDSSDSRCLEGHTLYTIDRNRGRCLTLHEDGTSGTFKISGDALYNAGANYTFENMFPTLVKSDWAVLAGHLWKENNDFVCPGAALGMHNDNCDCSWAHEQC